MIHPIPVNETYEFVLPNDKENPTIWILGHLDSITKMRILTSIFEVKYNTSNIANSEVVPLKNPMEMDLEACRFGLKGFKNFQLNGKDIEFETEEKQVFGKMYRVATDATLGSIPRNVTRELSEKILAEASISKEQEKNS